MQEKLIQTAMDAGRRYEKESLDYLQRFAGIDCGSRDEEGIRKAAEVVDELLRQLDGIEIEHYDCPGYGTHVVARLNSGNPNGKILISAHLDTVFKKGDTEKYPFHVEGDKAYGLGIADCKGGVVVSILAVKAMQEAGMLPDKELLFVFNCDEEIGSPSGVTLFDQVIKGVEMAFVFEPARDEDGVIVSRKGTGYLTIEVIGRGAHSGNNYNDGRSALLEVAHRARLLYENNLDERGIQFNIHNILSDDPFNVVPSRATARVCCRVAGKDDMETVKAIAKKVEEAQPYIPDTITRIRVDRFTEPMERTDANMKLYETVRRAGELLGMKLPVQGGNGRSDGNYFSSHGIPCVDGLGRYMYKLHSVDEHLRISSIGEKIALFSMVLGCL